jgi:hypothetical protein
MQRIQIAVQGGWNCIAFLAIRYDLLQFNKYLE